MYKTIGLVVCLCMFAGCSKEKSEQQSIATDTTDLSTAVTAWPLLPTSGYISGRIATEEDVANGNAVFAAVGSVTSDTMDIDVPQYAILRDDDGESTRVFVIQAEIVKGEGGNVETFGLRPVDGGDPVVGVSEGVRLLGTKRPTE